MKSGTCTSVTEKACQQYAASKGAAWKGTEEETGGIPKGCYHMQPSSTNEVWFNELPSANGACTNTLQCVCLASSDVTKA